MYLQNNVVKFEELFKKINRQGKDELLEYIKTTDMYIAPASSKYHLSCNGGLLQHSLNVYGVLKDMLLYNYNTGMYIYSINGVSVDYITEEGLIIISLLHDLCKTNIYIKSEDKYHIRDSMPIGHGEKSVIMISKYMDLTEKEILAIRWHMGYTEPINHWKYIDKAIEQYPIVLALHYADQIASKFMEEKNGNKINFENIYE